MPDGDGRARVRNAHPSEIEVDPSPECEFGLLKGRFVISEERARNIVRETEWKVRRFESCLQGKKR